MGLHQIPNEERWIFKIWAKEIVSLGVAWKKYMKVRELEENKRIWNLATASVSIFLEVIKTDGLSLMQIHPLLSRLIYSCLRNISRTHETGLLGFFLYLCFASKLTVTMEMTQCCQLLPECCLFYDKQFQVSGYAIFRFFQFHKK